jgi:hypothetical protein
VRFGKRGEKATHIVGRRGIVHSERDARADHLAACGLLHAAEW